MEEECMVESTGSGAVTRRGFLAATGSMLAAAPVISGMGTRAAEASEAYPASRFAEAATRKIPIPRRRLWSRGRALERCRESLHGYWLPGHYEYRKRGPDIAGRRWSRARRVGAQKRARRTAGRKVTDLEC